MNVVPSRFAVSANNSFPYVGREQFAELWSKWLKIKDNTRRRRAIYVYGSMGYGKSHLLAALACLLVRLGEHVVYLPDCRAMLQDPLEYLQTAFLLAFQNARDYWDAVLQSKDFEDLALLSHQFANGRKICFIVDQLNALDVEADGQDNISNKKKAALLNFLQKVSSRQVYITSASANFKTARYMETKQTDDEKIPLLGGMTPVSVVFYNYLSDALNLPVGNVTLVVTSRTGLRRFHSS
jgi:hypothetical protein